MSDELIAKKGSFIGIHSDREKPDQFSAGLLTAADKGWFCLTSIGRMGDFNCIFVGRTSEVLAISTSGAYLERLHQLSERALQNAEVFADIWGIFEFSLANKAVIAIEFFGDTEAYAIVRSYNSRLVTVYEFNEVIPEEVTTYPIDDILACRLGGKMALVWQQWHRRLYDGGIP